MKIGKAIKNSFKQLTKPVVLVSTLITSVVVGLITKFGDYQLSKYSWYNKIKGNINRALFGSGGVSE